MIMSYGHLPWVLGHINQLTTGVTVVIYCSFNYLATIYSIYICCTAKKINEVQARLHKCSWAYCKMRNYRILPRNSGFAFCLTKRVLLQQQCILNDNLSMAVLEITVGHWPFSDQFQHLADQNQFWSAIFPVHFQWNSNQ